MQSRCCIGMGTRLTGVSGPKVTRPTTNDATEATVSVRLWVMSTSRQDPGYPVDESIKDAVGVLTAFCVPDGVDDALIDRALENALQMLGYISMGIGLIRVERKRI